MVATAELSDWQDDGIVEIPLVAQIELELALSLHDDDLCERS